MQNIKRWNMSPREQLWCWFKKKWNKQKAVICAHRKDDPSPSKKIMGSWMKRWIITPPTVNSPGTHFALLRPVFLSVLRPFYVLEGSRHIQNYYQQQIVKIKAVCHLMCLMYLLKTSEWVLFFFHCSCWKLLSVCSFLLYIQWTLIFIF